MKVRGNLPVDTRAPEMPRLSVDECWNLLRSHMVGGVGISYHERVHSKPYRNPNNEYRGADYAMHSCEQREIQSGFGWSWAYYTKTTPLLDAAIDELFESLQLTFNEPRELWSQFKGLWYLPLSGKVQSLYAASFEISKSLAFLEYLGSENLKAVVQSFVDRAPDLALVSEPRQEQIRNPNHPYSRLGTFVSDTVLQDYILQKSKLVPLQIVSELLMRRYITALHECEHFDIARCIVCDENFHPEGCRLLPICGAPPVICASCVGVFDGESHQEVLYRAPSPRSLASHEQITSLLGSALLNFFDEFSYIPATDLQLRNELARVTYKEADRDVYISRFKLLAVVAPFYLAKLHFRSNAIYLDSVGLFEGRAPQGGYRSIASDGHICLSLGERSICEFFVSLGIHHEKEPRYPPHSELNPNGLYRADFKVGEWLIEFAGRMSIPEYAARMKDKQKLARSAGLKLCVLEPRDLFDLTSKLKKVLNQFGNGLTESE